MTILTRNTQQLKRVVQQHVTTDSILQGRYWDERDNRGCFIGCLAHSSDPSPLVDLYGLPLYLIRISEAIFEHLPEDEAKDFFASFPDAIAVDGKDLSLVHWKFLLAALQALPEQPAEIKAVIDPVIRGISQLASGGEWSFAEAIAAAEAAMAAARVAARAARVAARAAWVAARVAARAATWAAAGAADAAWDAAGAAEAAVLVAVWAANAAAASNNEARRQRDLLLELIKQAPVLSAS